MDDLYYPDEDKVLIVDDNATNLRHLIETLKPYYKVYAAPSGEWALKFLEKHTPDLILLDVEMPGMSGYDVISRLKQDSRWADIPVLFLTAQEGRDKERRAFDMGAVDYILKPIFAGVVLARVRTHMELQMYRKNLEYLVELKTSQLEITQDSILSMLSNVTAYRDNETGAHIKRTTYYVDSITKHLMSIRQKGYNITTEYSRNVVRSAKLHDIGKVAIPDNILLKPGRLTDEEFDLIKQHTILGAQILDDAMADLGDTSSFLTVAREIIITHHEWWNGRGYPQKLVGTEIPISGRIMAIADVYDALISARPYKNSMTHEQALDIIIGDAGTHFDPELVELCKPVYDTFPEIAERYRDEHYQMRMLR